MTGTVDPAVLAAGGIRLDVGAPVATVTLDRPETRNAQTPATWAALKAIGTSLTEDVRVVVVRGEGGTFSSGLDRRMLEFGGAPGEASLLDLLALSDDQLEATIAGYQGGFTWLQRPDVVSIAAVRGAAVGAGFQLALACDLRVLADDARFAMREPALGLVPDLTGTKALVDCVGYSRAMEICATTRWVPADEALAIGLATSVVPPAKLDDAVAELTAALLSPVAGAVRETKALLQSAGRLGRAEQDVAERRAQVRRLRALGSTQ